MHAGRVARELRFVELVWCLLAWLPSMICSSSRTFHQQRTSRVSPVFSYFFQRRDATLSAAIRRQAPSFLLIAATFEPCRLTSVLYGDTFSMRIETISAGLLAFGPFVNLLSQVNPLSPHLTP